MRTLEAVCEPGERRSSAPSDLLERVERKFGLSPRPGDARLGEALRLLGVSSEGTRPADLGAFVQSLLIHETFFFRHPRQLAEIERDVLPALASQATAEGRETVPIWSASCSTGEEAWTLALLADAAIPGRARITGSDLSASAIETAQAGSYRRSLGLGSFRSLTPDALARLGGAMAPGAVWSAPAALRRQVGFLQHNLLDPPPIRRQDLVLCRNTLIYMSPRAQRRAIDVIAQSLRPGGYLALGPAESPGGDPRFERVGSDEAMLFRRLSDTRATDGE